MARGWESKSVEEQRSSVVEARVADSGNKMVTEDERRAAELQRTTRERQLQALNLQRENILSQRTSNSGRRAALESALQQIEAQIQSLG
jgi:hypothetical protein